MLQQRLACTALVPLWDPIAARIATEAGVGQEITLSLGAGVDSDFYGPVQVTATVAALADGRLDVRVGNNTSVDMGRTALLQAGCIHIMVSEHRGVSGNHPAVYRRLGVEPAEAQMAVVKTASNWQYYADMTSEVIRVDTPGPTMSRMEEFPWRHLPRPIYPLDRELDWRAER